MPTAPVEVTIAGQAYRLRTDAEPNKLRHLAALVDDQVRACDPNGRLTPAQALLYAALTLAEQLEDQRAEKEHSDSTTRNALQGLLHRIDAALDATDSAFVTATRDLHHNARS